MSALIYIFLLLLLFVIPSCALALFGEFQTLLAWWFAIGCMLPGLLLAFNSSQISLKVFCLISFVTQFITVPLAYLQRESYGFTEKPYDFMAISILPIFIRIGFFILTLSIITRLLEIKYKPKAINLFKFKNSINLNQTYYKKVSKKKNTRNNFLILILLLLCIPLFNFTFENGIAMTGIAPPRLPFHLTGILFYFKTIIIPAIVFFLYSRSNRDNYFILFLILFFSLFNGLTSVSKSVVILTASPILFYSLVDKKKVLFILVGIFTLLSTGIAATARDFIYITGSSEATANTSLGVFGSIMYLFQNYDITNKLFIIFTGLIGRIEDFQSLILASQFNADMIGGPLSILLKAISNNLAVWDHDAYHIAWQGYTIPEGFFNGGSYLCWVLMASNSNFLMIFPFALLVSLFLFLIEKNSDNISEKYQIRTSIKLAIIIYLTLLTFTAPGGVSVYFIILLIILRFAAKFSFK